MLTRYFLHVEVATTLVCGGTLTGTVQSTVSSFEDEYDWPDVAVAVASQEASAPAFTSPALAWANTLAPSVRPNDCSKVSFVVFATLTLFAYELVCSTDVRFVKS